MLIKLAILGCILFSVVGCSEMSTSDDSDLTETPLPQISTSTDSDFIEEPIVLPTLNAIDSTQLQANHAYRVSFIILSASARIRIYDDNSSLQDPLASYELEAQISESPFPTYSSTEQLNNEWLGTYLLHALNTKIEGVSIPISEFSGMITASPDAQILVFGVCTVYGGRGQYCRQSDLWIFDLITGQYHIIETDLRRLYELHFSDDSQEIIAEGCLEYPNAYFGWCGDSAIVTWSITDGDERNRVVMTPAPSGTQ